MGKQQLEKDRVTSLLQLEDWEDDQTATTAGTTLADSDSEGEDEADPEAAFEEENRYREPPSIPLYRGQGASNTIENVLNLPVCGASNKNKRARDTTSADDEDETRPKVSKVKVVRCDVAVRAVPAASTGGSTVPMDKRAVPRPDTLRAHHGVAAAVRAEPAARTEGSKVPTGAQAVPRPVTLRAEPAVRASGSEENAKTRPDVRISHAEPAASTNPMAERAQQRVKDPRHWLEMPANNHNNTKEVARRKALAKELMGEEALKPVKIRGLMCPRLRALEHPAASLLKEYASQGCPVDVGRDWTLEELVAAVEKGPHQSALEPDAIKQIQIEAREKENQGFAKIYAWEWLKKNLQKHPRLKLSPLAMIPHKSRNYRAILDLSFQLLVAGYLLPSINDATKDWAPEEAIAQIGSVLPRIIEALARVDTSKGPISLMKVDLTDGFWRIMAREGEEWNFAYVLPNFPGEPIEIVVPAALQMGWALSPSFFCAASETARDVSEQLAHEPVGTLPEHPLEELTMPAKIQLPSIGTAKEGIAFLHMLEVFVDDFIQLAQTTDETALRHCSRAVLHRIHSVFPPPNVTGHNGADPVSKKKLLKGEGVWDVRKEILGWVIDGATLCIELSTSKQEAIERELKQALKKKRGLPFKKFEKLVGKLRHASVGIPAGKYLFGPINQLIAIHPRIIHWKRAPVAWQAMRDLGQLIKEAGTQPTHVKELVVGDAAYKGTLDASGGGAGGVWLPGTKALAPIVWRWEWPQEIRDALITFENPNGTITNSDLEMAAELLGWLVLEANVPLEHEHVGLCSDNSATVAWQMRGASKRSAVANRLLRVLATRMRHCRASPLVTRHLAGKRNHLGDIPSRSFGYKEEWHFEKDKDFLTYFNQIFPLPDKNTWTGFRLNYAVAMKVTRELLTQGSSMAEWRQLPTLGARHGKSGKPTVELTECLHTWTAVILRRWPGLHSISAECSDKEEAEKESQSALAVWEQDLEVSPRKSVWTGGKDPCTNQEATNSSCQSSTC